MSIVNSLFLNLFLCLALSIKPSITHESTKKIVESSQKPETSTSELPEIVKFAKTSIVPIKSRILERTTYLKPARNLVNSENSTLFVTIVNEEEKNISTTTRRPLSLGDFSTSSGNVNFKPSIHLGEIDELKERKSNNVNNPFNNVQNVRFENTVSLNDEERFNTDRVKAPVTSSYRDDERASIASVRKKIPEKFFETDSRYGIAVPVEIVHHQHQEFFQPHQMQQITEQQIDHDNNYMGDNNSDNNDNNNDNEHQHHHNDHQQTPMGHETLVTFEYPKSPGYITVTSRPMTLGRPVYPSMIMSDVQPMHKPQYHYEPTHDNVQTIYVKPSKYQDNIVTVPTKNVQFQHYEYAPPASGEAIEKPEVSNYHQNYHHDGNYEHSSSHDNEMQNIGKPDSVLYLTSHRETAFTRMRKFPYKFYEPSLVLGHQDGYHYLHDEQHAFPSKERRVSPWKKIIHLIGAFLPLGLLLATLKPNVVKIENTTQPNIVLSKLRVVDLPAEHKRGRLVDGHQEEYQYQDTCDDRSICELIVSGSEPSSNLLQNILWNLTTKSTDAEAQKHGLHEIFSAAKRKDCSTIDC